MHRLSTRTVALLILLNDNHTQILHHPLSKEQLLRIRCTRQLRAKSDLGDLIQ